MLCSSNLSQAKEQPESSEAFSALENTTAFGVALPKKPAVPDPKHTDQAMFSCGSLAPKLKGGCMDHGFSRCAFTSVQHQHGMHVTTTVIALFQVKI